MKEIFKVIGNRESLAFSVIGLYFVKVEVQLNKKPRNCRAI
jgi:hypothetical protein